MSSFYGNPGGNSGGEGKGGKVSIQSSTSEEYEKIYIIYQDDDPVGSIEIPKDVYVESGTVEVNPDGQENGTYIKLTFKNNDQKDVFINVDKLIDKYSVSEEETVIKLSIDDNKVIKAEINSNSIELNMLKSEAIESIKSDAVKQAKEYTDKIKFDVEDNVLTIELPE